MDTALNLPKPCDLGSFSTGGSLADPGGVCRPCPPGYTTQTDQSIAEWECNGELLLLVMLLQLLPTSLACLSYNTLTSCNYGSVVFLQLALWIMAAPAVDSATTIWHVALSYHHRLAYFATNSLAAIILPVALPASCSVHCGPRQCQLQLLSL